MCRRLQGKVAIVTGGAGFLGYHHCLHLAGEGAKVVVADAVDGQATVEAVKKDGGEAIFMQIDVTNFDECRGVADETLDTFGHIDILVNNAGVTTNMRKPWTEFTPEEWDHKMAVDLRGSFQCARAVFPEMKARRYGKIINIASLTGLTGMPHLLAHVSAKAAVIGFTRALATEVGEYDVNVNAIIVGRYAPKEIIEAEADRLLPTQTFKRLPDPNDLSRVVVFLAADDSRWITGQAIAVTGGAGRTGG